METTFAPCRLCMKKSGPQPGYYYVKKEGYTYVKECDCHKNWIEKQSIKRRLREANVWNTDYKIENYKGSKSYEDVIMLSKFVDQFDIRFRDKMVYMYGPNGTQKTTLAMWVAKSLILKGFSVYYTLMESLSVALTPDFEDSTGNREAVVDKALNCDLLVVDESWDKSKLTLYKSGYQIPFIDRFIRDRYDINRRGILFVSNKRPNTIAEQGFGDSLQNLIMRNVKESTLEFHDVYIDSCNTIDSKGLFR